MRSMVVLLRRAWRVSSAREIDSPGDRARSWMTSMARESESRRYVSFRVTVLYRRGGDVEGKFAGIVRKGRSSVSLRGM